MCLIDEYLLRIVSIHLHILKETELRYSTKTSGFVVIKLAVIDFTSVMHYVSAIYAYIIRRHGSIQGRLLEL